MAAPKRRHQKASSVINNLIFNYLSGKTCEVYDAPFDVQLPVPNPPKPGSVETVVQPDICVICDPAKLDEAGCVGAPDWIIEITSPRTIKNDFNEKFNLYQQTGVLEYWVVLPNEKAVHVYVLEAGQYELVDVYESGSVPCRLFPDLTIEHADIFA
jgi:Uma2 family endonuclease